MNTEIVNLNLLVQTIRDSLDNNNYENLGEYSNCSKCQKALTRGVYEKDRTICRNCFKYIVLNYIKKKYDMKTSDKNNKNKFKKDSDSKFVSLKNNIKFTSTRSKIDKKDAFANKVEDIDFIILSEKKRLFTNRILDHQNTL